MEVMTAKMGWCFGIQRAYRLSDKKALDAGDQPVYTAHSPSPPGSEDLDTLRRIEARDQRLLEAYPGLGRVTVIQDTSRLKKGDSLLLGWHGLPYEEKEGLVARGVSVSDYHCPFLVNLDKKVEMLVKDGFNIMFVGQKQNHHCLYAKKLAEQNNRTCFVIEQLADLESMSSAGSGPWALVGQVTANTLLWEAVVRWNQETKRAQKVQGTICTDSFGRQQEAISLAKQTEVTLLVEAGAPSVSLYEVIVTAGKPVYRVRWREDGSWKKAIQEDWFVNFETVAVVGGILIPEWAIDEVASYIREVMKSPSSTRK